MQRQRRGLPAATAAARRRRPAAKALPQQVGDSTAAAVRLA